MKHLKTIILTTIILLLSMSLISCKEETLKEEKIPAAPPPPPAPAPEIILEGDDVYFRAFLQNERKQFLPLPGLHAAHIQTGHQQLQIIDDAFKIVRDGLTGVGGPFLLQFPGEGFKIARGGIDQHQTDHRYRNNGKKGQHQGDGSEQLHSELADPLCSSLRRIRSINFTIFLGLNGLLI